MVWYDMVWYGYFVLPDCHYYSMFSMISCCMLAKYNITKEHLLGCTWHKGTYGAIYTMFTWLINAMTLKIFPIK